MSGKHSRHTPSPASPTQQHSSKLPKFLQKQSTRDRSKSVSQDPTTSLRDEIPPTISSPDSPSPSQKHFRKSQRSTTSRQSGQNDGLDLLDSTEAVDTPVIVEPEPFTPSARPRTRSERPGASSLSERARNAAMYSPASPSSSSRIGDLPTRLSGWFSQTFNTSSTDLTLPSVLSQTHLHSSPASAGPGTSPKTKLGASALFTAAKHVKGHLDKAGRYLLDSDASPDKCTDPIWLLGVEHPGYDTPPPSSFHTHSHPPGRRGSLETKKTRVPSPSFRSSTSSTASNSNSSTDHSSASLSHSLSSSSSASSTPRPPGANWPPVFYSDFTSRIWLTYRSQFTPIKDGHLVDLSPPTHDTASSSSNASSYSYKSPSQLDNSITHPSSTLNRRWNWGAMVGGGEREWTSDSGWGCMLRTGQSLLANALVHVHLGRDWRRPDETVRTQQYAKYVQIVTWFLDTPAPEAPFSVHRMALAGKELGTDVGQWFGPSVAAGAIKSLVQSFPESGLGVSVATDGQVVQSDVFAASSTSSGSSHRRYPHKRGAVLTHWGDRPVLILIGIRLGLDRVNPIYYDTIKQLYTFPQSVGIAGGRPSSSYYFVGSQAENLFYLDPHHARPAVPLRLPPTDHHSTTSLVDSDLDAHSPSKKSRRRGHHDRSATSSSSSGSGSNRHSRGATSTSSSRSSAFSPSPLQQEFMSSTSASSTTILQRSIREQSLAFSRMDTGELGDTLEPEEPLEPLQEHLVSAYSSSELKTFHCERVRKMPLSGLDPSMLIGFLCQSEADWTDFCERVGKLPRTIFSIVDEPPQWPSDSDDNMGLESMSDPDELVMEMDDEEEDDDQSSDRYYDTRSTSASTSSQSQRRSDRSKSEEADTEEDPVDPITPGPTSKFNIAASNNKDFDDESFFEPLDDIEDDWVDPSLPSSPTQSPPTPPEPDNSSHGSRKKGKRGQKQVPVPVPAVMITSQEHYPFPVSHRPEDVVAGQDRSRKSSKEGFSKRMHNAKARDGGRTQSGGVKGILTED